MKKPGIDGLDRARVGISEAMIRVQNERQPLTIVNERDVFGHPDIMRGRLLAENIPFIDEYQVDLRTTIWDPTDDPELDHLYPYEQS